MQLFLLLEQTKTLDEFITVLSGNKETLKQVIVEDFFLNSKQVKQNSIFVAMPSESGASNTIDYIEEAINNKASVILTYKNDVVEDDLKKKISKYKDVVFLSSNNLQKSLGILLKCFFETKLTEAGKKYPQVYAVTGTNGKSSVVSFLKQMWQLLGINSGSIGTIGVFWGNNFKPLSLTTPDLITLHKEIYNFALNNVKKVAIEASSHGIVQGRIEGIELQSAGFTNITHDHLDYHKTFENYFEAKKLLFTKYLNKSGTAILNLDDENIKEFASDITKEEFHMLTFGSARKANLRLKDLNINNFKQTFKLEYENEQLEFSSPLIGKFQIENLMCAISFLLAEGVPLKNLQEIIPQIKAPSGRMENLGDILKNGSRVIIDYAHTPDGLEKVLKTLKNYSSKSIIVIFGCGGDRDKTKRPIMGMIAEKYADIVIVTDDNPRTEDPDSIRNDILKNVIAFNIGDRKQAILQGLKLLKREFTLVIAGKGHEEFQVYGTQSQPFSDKQIALELAKEF